MVTRPERVAPRRRTNRTSAVSSSERRTTSTADVDEPRPQRRPRLSRRGPGRRRSADRARNLGRDHAQRQPPRPRPAAPSAPRRIGHAADPPAQQRRAHHGGDEVRARSTPARDPGRRGWRNSTTASTTFRPFSNSVEDERRARVLQRVERAHHVQVHRERHEADREGLQRVGGDGGVVRGELMPHDHREHRLREHREQHRRRGARAPRCSGARARTRGADPSRSPASRAPRERWASSWS